jgi:hypothetical protein
MQPDRRDCVLLRVRVTLQRAGATGRSPDARALPHQLPSTRQPRLLRHQGQR